MHRTAAAGGKSCSGSSLASFRSSHHRWVCRLSRLGRMNVNRRITCCAIESAAPTSRMPCEGPGFHVGPGSVRVLLNHTQRHA